MDRAERIGKEEPRRGFSHKKSSLSLVPDRIASLFWHFSRFLAFGCLAARLIPSVHPHLTMATWALSGVSYLVLPFEVLFGSLNYYTRPPEAAPKRLYLKIYYSEHF